MGDFVYYPLQDYGPLMKGMVVAAVAVLHVFLAQFAIGGGMLMCYFQWLAQTERNPHARQFVDGYFTVLVMVSFVLGAMTGVGIWFTVIQTSPPTIGLMVGQFHWVWAIEWTFFCLEVMAGYCFYRYRRYLNDNARLSLLVVYTLAAWFSLFWINGILSWQLTPGAWVESRALWDGFFNPGFWPSLFFRTVVAMTIAALVSCVVINTMKDLTRKERQSLINHAAKFLAPMMLMPLLGIWYFSSMPADSRNWVLGGSIAMNLFLNIAVGSSVLIGLYALVGLVRSQLYINGFTAALLCALAFGATAGGEFVREGVRKPYTVRQILYSNSVRPEMVAELRKTGCSPGDPYPLQNPERYPTEQLRLGAKVYRFQCSICHTLHGANALTDLIGSWSPDQARMNIAQLQNTKAFMPPFAGNAEEVEALAQMLMWSAAEQPKEWPVTNDPAVLARINQWLVEAGTKSGNFQRYHTAQEQLSAAPAKAIPPVE